MPVTSQGLRLFFLLKLALMTSGCPATDKSIDSIRIFCAVSAAPAVNEALKTFTRHNVIINTAASSVLAKQIQQGAHADLFIGADQRWTTWLTTRSQLEEASVHPLFSNRLVVVSSVPGSSWPPVAPSTTKIAIADPSHVPLGTYTRATLGELGLWETLSKSFIHAKDARSAIVLAEQGETELAITYKTDAIASKRVRTIHELPRSSPAIVYPIAIVRNRDNKRVRRLYRHLLSATSVYQGLGFVAVP